MAASYIEALISPEETDQRWNYGAPVGTTVPNVNFSFMTAKPSYSVPDSNPSTVDEGTNFNVFTPAQEDAARAILNLYENYININFTEVADANDDSTQIRFGRHDTTGGEAGYAYTPGEYVPGFEFTLANGDVWIVNDDYNLDVEPGGAGYSTIVHEVGHALGLKHPFQPEGNHSTLPSAQDNARYSVMSYTDYPDNIFRRVTGTTSEDIDFIFVEPSTPMLYDIAALQYLYGANMSYNASSTTYSFENNVPFATCIWDGGGIDTISVSNFSRGCTINLNGGKFSSITMISDPLPPGFVGGTEPDYRGVNNLSIAYGAIIENATGGSGSDRLTGNAVKNVLIGNGGNDTIDGAAGNDVLNGGVGRDRLVGGTGNDTLTWDGLDTKADGGAGVDVLKFTTTDLDLTAILNTKIINIETIDMRGGGNNALTLTQDDLLDISTTTNTLKVLGNVGDEVRLQTGFTQGATAAGFVTWQNGSAIAKIGVDVNVELF